MSAGAQESAPAGSAAAALPEATATPAAPPTEPSESAAATEASPTPQDEPDKGNQPSQPDTYPPCTSTASDDSMRAAKGAFQAGTAAFNEADYERAIVYWEDAFRRDCSAVAMLKNLARAYELNEQYPKAIAALTAYLARQKATGEERAIERRVKNLQRKMDEERARRESSSRAKAQESAPTPDAPKPAFEPVHFDDDAFTKPESGRSVVPLVVAGLGLGVGILGVVQWQSAAADLKALEPRCPNHDCADPNDQAAGNTARTDIQIWGYGVAGGGGAIMAAGLLWYILQETDSEDTGIRAGVAPGFASLSYSGSF